MAEQLICNQQVDGSTPFTSSSDIRRPSRRIILELQFYKGAFPSGQRGQTVNLLAMPSVVRIHPLPPQEKPCTNVQGFSCGARGVPLGRRVVKICEADLHATRQGGGRIGGSAAVHPLRLCRAFLVVRVVSLRDAAW